MTRRTRLTTIGHNRKVRKGSLSGRLFVYLGGEVWWGPADTKFQVGAWVGCLYTAHSQAILVADGLGLEEVWKPKP